MSKLQSCGYIVGQVVSFDYSRPPVQIGDADVAWYGFQTPPQRR